MAIENHVLFLMLLSAICNSVFRENRVKVDQVWLDSRVVVVIFCATWQYSRVIPSQRDKRASLSLKCFLFVTLLLRNTGGSCTS